MFKLTQTSNMRGDCTANYAVTLDKTYTIGEFIQTVLTATPDEWGYVGIDDRAAPFLQPESIFGNPNCEYRSGKLVTQLPDDILDKTIKSVTASGGWSRMDYLLVIKQDDDTPKNEPQTISAKPKPAGTIEVSVNTPMTIKVALTETDIQRWMDNCMDQEVLLRLAKYAKSCASSMDSETDSFRSLA